MTFLLFFLLLHSRLTHSLTFLTSPNDLNVSVNLPAQFTCYVLHDSSIFLTWTHNSQDFPCASGCPITEGYSFSTAFSSSSTLSIMIIDSVGLGDAGMVSCKVDQLPNPSISMSADLVVNDVLDFIQLPVDVVRNFGDSATFYCGANKEGGEYVWKRSELTIPSDPR